MLFFRKRKKPKSVFKCVTAYEVVANSALFFYGLQSRFGMDNELVILLKQAVNVCTAICKRLKVLEK